MTRHPLPRLAAALAALCLAAGCISLHQTYPEKRYFTLDVERHGDPAPEPLAPRLHVRNFRVSPLYSGTNFIYRHDARRIERDFYSEFFVAPRDLLREATVEWLRAAGLFEQVVESSSSLVPTHYLEGDVRAVYIDLSGEPESRAVLEIQFTFIDVRPAQPRLLLRRDYRAATPLAGDDPEAAVEAWEKAVGEVLGKLEADLQAALTEDTE